VESSWNEKRRFRLTPSGAGQRWRMRDAGCWMEDAGWGPETGEDPTERSVDPSDPCGSYPAIQHPASCILHPASSISHPASVRLRRVGRHLTGGVGADGIALAGVVVGQPVP